MQLYHHFPSSTEQINDPIVQLRRKWPKSGTMGVFLTADLVDLVVCARQPWVEEDGYGWSRTCCVYVIVSIRLDEMPVFVLTCCQNWKWTLLWLAKWAFKWAAASKHSEKLEMYACQRIHFEFNLYNKILLTVAHPHERWSCKNFKLNMSDGYTQWHKWYTT